VNRKKLLSLRFSAQPSGAISGKQKRILDESVFRVSAQVILAMAKHSARCRVN
jgi:hypothetical protein